MKNLNNTHIIRSIRVMILFFSGIALFSVFWYGYQEYLITVDNAIRHTWLRSTFEHLFMTIILLIPIGLLYKRLLNRLTAEQETSDEIALLSRLVEQSPVTIAITDKDGKIEYVNNGFCNLTGYSREEAIGQNPRVLKTEFTPPETFVEMWRTLTSGYEWHGELCNKKKDGSLYWEMAHIFPVINSYGELTHYAAIKENITAQKKAEEELNLARNAAEEANHSKSLFLATMSHEIRTPMNAVLGMSYLALPTQLDPRQRGYIEKVTVAAKSLLTIINDILDFSKIEAGKMRVESIPIKLDEVLESVTSIIRVAADEKGLVVIYHIEPDVPMTVMGDPTRLQQILLNLGGNAVKFTEHGKVNISIKLLTPKIDDGMVAISFIVEDSGIGMNPEQVDKIFAPFTQADSSITRKYGGTGLGLSIAKKIVELMGGTLEVTSIPLHGSIFSFTLVMPTYCPVECGMENSLIDNFTFEGFVGAKVLLMEDDPINQIIVQEMLSKLFLQVTTVDNGKKGVELILGSAEPFELVFTDIQMPEMDGCQATTLIRKHFDKDTLPIIAMTGYVLPDEVKQLLACGINDHIAKPIDPNYLKQILCKWIKKGERNVPLLTQSEKKECFSFSKHIPGFNLKSALNRLGGDSDLLLSVISDATPQLIKSVRDIQQNLNVLPLQKDTLIFDLHSLAGSSSNIGAETISKTSRTLEHYFKGDITESYQELVTAFESDSIEFVTSLHLIKTINKDEMLTESFLSEKQVHFLLCKLYGQIKKNLGDSLHTCRDLKQSSPVIPNMDKLEAEIKRFDFKAAVATLAEIAFTLNLSLEEKNNE